MEIPTVGHNQPMHTRISPGGGVPLSPYPSGLQPAAPSPVVHTQPIHIRPSTPHHPGVMPWPQHPPHWGGWSPYYPWTYPVAAFPSETPLTPQQIFNTPTPTVEQAELYCERIYWPYCEYRPQGLYCRTFAAYCLEHS